MLFTDNKTKHWFVCSARRITAECRLYRSSIRIKHGYAVLKGRRERDIVRPLARCSNCTRVTDGYCIVFVEINLAAKSGWDSPGNTDLDCCVARLSSVRCVALSRWRSVLILVSSN